MAEIIEGFFEGLNLAPNGETDPMAPLAALLEMSDENFKVIAPAVLNEFERSLNIPGNKLELVMAYNAMGYTSDNLEAAFQTLTETLTESEADAISAEKRDFILQLIGIILNTLKEAEGTAKKSVKIPIEFCHPNAKMPQYANLSDSGLDVFALEEYTINPGETKLIPTGVKVAIPIGYELQVRPKSGRALKTKLRVANTPGTIDAGYRDEICVIVENIEPPFKDIEYHFDDNGKIIIDSILHGSSYTIGEGEKFAQLVLMEVPKASFYNVENVGELGENRGGGFGSTGLK